jgi:subtilisin family serine protease
LNNAAVSVACSLDQTFIRVKNVQGAFDVEVTDADGNPRVVSMEEGSAIKIWRKASEAADEMIVTLLITAPDGTLVEAINYRKTDGVEKLAAAAGEEGSDGEEPAAEGDDDDDDEGIDPGEDVETTPATTTLGGEDTETESESVVVGFGGPGPGRPTPTQIGFGRD